MKFLIFFLYLISTSLSYSIERPDIKNIVVHKEPITYEKVTFKDISGKNIDLKNFENNLLILNFWATWCAPCREEMPSLDLLQSNKKLNNLKVLPINIGQEDLSKSIKFFKELKIKNLDIYFDPSIDLAKKFSLRGLPTSILFNKEGKEFARIIGIVNFTDEKLINWLGNFN